LYQRAVQVAPNKVENYLRVAGVYEMIGDTQHAVLMYRKSLEIDPENELAQGRLNVLGK